MLGQETATDGKPGLTDVVGCVTASTALGMTKLASNARGSGFRRTHCGVWVILAYGAFAVWPSLAFGNEIYKFDQADSTIAFKVRHLVGTAKGKFTKFNGTIEVEREHPEKSSVVATIQAVSIDTTNAKRDEHLRTADFFDVGKFPEITFKSRRVKQTGPNAGEIVGDLTMHGVTRPITLNVQLLGQAESATKNPTTRWRVTTAPLKRSDFGIGQGTGGAWMIGNDVAVEIEIEAARAK